MLDSKDIRLDSPKVSLPDLDNLKSTYGISRIKRSFPGLNATMNRIYKVYFTAHDKVSALITGFENLLYIEYAEKVPLFHSQYEPNDQQPQQYYLGKINASGAWDITKGSKNVVLAVVDNAILLTHNDLRSNLWVNKSENSGMQGIDDDLNGYTDDLHGYDVADNDPDPNPPDNIDDNSGFVHGTHVAGIAAATTDNDTGIASVGFKVRIMPVKCSPDSSDGNVLTNAYDGVYYAIRNGADVINMSWSGPNMTITGDNLLQTADDMNIVLVGAAGNADSSQKFYPAAYDQVLAVGATNELDKKASFSNYGNWVDLMAPGTNIYSAKAGSNSSYGNLNGTSMSTPMVSGLAGLVKSKYPNISDEDNKARIIQGCDDIDFANPKYQGKLGAGRINAGKTLSAKTGIHIASGNDRQAYLFPVPAGHQVRLRYGEKVNRITIMSRHGKRMDTYEDLRISPQGIYKFSTAHYPPGIYILTARGESNLIRKKFIVVH